ncbi:MAG: radical SAM protein [Deltaproteobacteria bacterium]|nr:MAG: radical SAM protein [Deltaproteobacteria bacterium]
MPNLRKYIKSDLTFEQGPIRPPSEARSLLMRFTRNCPWNKCTFCPIYKGQKFSRRSVKEIKRDIDNISEIIDDIKCISLALGEGGRLTRDVLKIIWSQTSAYYYRTVALWLYYGEGNVFIQDANSLIMPTSDLVEVLRYLKEKIPGVRRITSYARSSTLSRKTLEEIKELKEAGLTRIHIGLESGSDNVLKFVKKGTTAAKHIDAGVKVKEAGITLSEYVMPGLGGKRWWEEHALETARVLNEINPDFIRLRSLRIPPTAPLYQDFVSGRFEPLSDDEVVREIRLFIKSLEGITSTLTSDHIINLLEEVEGTFPQDKEKMLSVIDRYLNLPEREKLLYRLGRRGGTLRCLDDLKDPVLRDKLETALNDLSREAPEGIEQIIDELGNQYI